MKNKLHERVDTGCHVRKVNEEERTATFLAQSTALASDRLVILAKAGKKRNKEFMKNPIVVPYHMRANYETGEPVVIGKVVHSEFKDEGMEQTIKFAETDLANDWFELVRDGFVNMVSIAWDWNDKRETDPVKMKKLLDKNGIKLKDEEHAELLGVVTEYRQKDLSLVTIGADPKAMGRAAEEGNEVAAEFIRSLEDAQDPPETPEVTETDDSTDLEKETPVRSETNITITVNGKPLSDDKRDEFFKNLSEQIMANYKHSENTEEETEDPENDQTPELENDDQETEGEHDDQEDPEEKRSDLYGDLLDEFNPNHEKKKSFDDSLLDLAKETNQKLIGE